jgi:molecular chaperone Hsp33
MYDFRARCVIVSTKDIVRELKTRHGLDPLTTIALGRAISCVAMLASTLKQDAEYVSCSWSGTGILEKVYAECTGSGDCRGYTRPESVAEDLEIEELQPECVGDVLGTTGTLTVLRGRRDGSATPYTAVSEFMNGEIAADVARYLAESEQIPSAVAAGVKLSPEGEVLSSGGILVQKIAGTDLDDEILKDLEQRMSKDLNLSDRLAAGASHDELLSLLHKGNASHGLLLERNLQFGCTCSRDRMIAALVMLGEDQIKQILDEFGKIEARCPYCAATEQFRIEELTVQ